MLIFDGIISLATSIVGGIKDSQEDKRKLKRAKTDARINRMHNAQNHDQKWEILQLEQNGWKDDVLFYAFIAMFIWAGFCPEAAHEFFQNLDILPPWFVKTWMWLVASVLGVKKIGDYAPKMIKELKDAIKK